MRRLAPRRFETVLEDLVHEAAPAGILAQVQARWAKVAGPAIAAVAEPVSEREGVVTVACESSAWAQELELLGGDLRARMNVELGDPQRVRELRFRVSRA